MPERGSSPDRRSVLRSLERIVVKVGSHVIADEGGGLARERLDTLADEVSRLRRRGIATTLVSSGAIAAGRAAFPRRRAPRSIPERQAAAAVGQIELMSSYREAFARRGLAVAQVLLDAADLANRQRFLNAEHTLRTLHRLGVVPVVNENDTVAVDELKFGDNDALSALVASLTAADLLVILSDVDALYSGDPRHRADVRPIRLLTRVDAAALALAGDAPSELGTGGMRSKLLAARRAASAGIATLIAGGRASDALTRALDPAGEAGTLVLPRTDRLARRKHWIAFARPPRGTLRCDDGARAAVLERGRSLLPSGVVEVAGHFAAGDCVRLLGPDGREFARGLSSYHAAEATRIAGRRSAEIERILGYSLGDAMVHRDDLVLTDAEPSGEESPRA